MEREPARRFSPPVIIHIGDGLRFDEWIRPRGGGSGVGSAGKRLDAIVRSIPLWDFRGVFLFCDLPRHPEGPPWFGIYDWDEFGPNGPIEIVPRKRQFGG